MVAVTLCGEDRPFENIGINVTRWWQRSQYRAMAARLDLGDDLMIGEIIPRRVVVRTMICSIALAHTLIENLIVFVNVTDKRLFPALRANPFSTFRQTVLMLYHR